MTEQEALVVLNAIPGVGPHRIKALREYYGDAVTALKQPYLELDASGILPREINTNIVHFSKDNFLADEYNQVRQKNITVLTAADESFPHLLSQIPGAPVVLYIMGHQSVLHQAAVGIVGSRMCSFYGKAQAERFASTFGQAGITVVSGMARGIDTFAHQGCLKAKGQTVAVLGCGLEHVYPKENKALMETIVANGAVISEMPIRTPAIPANFPRRNRIITGLSLATVVIEAGEKSGALISAGYALEQGRDVFAVPANIDESTARGSNMLLKDGAQMALSPQDVLDVFRSQVELVFPEVGSNHAPTLVLNESESALYNLLSSVPVHADDLSDRAGIPIGQIAQVMLALQLKELVQELPGKHFIKVHHG